ncbi:hypothetical protein DNTS_015078 [Danionella cerebrum]|uniref:C-type lectin domain-containing protein n=1 Tax=Danionella cerebrum TaxID=2873325 RepID=A0A553Q098_9TELE|nr:hypothetical protein DNTS_015078 [Danionella translucida]
MWQEAQLYCRENYLDLATIQSKEERAELIKLALSEGFSSFAWIGLSKGVSKWRWSYKDELMSYHNWDEWEPHLPSTEKSCAFIDGDNLWGDSSCSIEIPFFCQTDHNQTSQKFIYNTSKLSWHEAQQFCRGNYVDLATIINETENAVLGAIQMNGVTWGSWIGLSRNPWLWSDGTDVSWPLLNWQQGQPDNIGGFEDCASAGIQGEIADESCDSQRYFYCKRYPPFSRVQLLRVELRSTVSLTEAAVTEAIEKQGSQKIMEAKETEVMGLELRTEMVQMLEWKNRSTSEEHQEQIGREERPLQKETMNLN